MRTVCTCSWSSLECETLCRLAQPFPFGGFPGGGAPPNKRTPEHGQGRAIGVSVEREHLLIEGHQLRRRRID